jgi:hypothetical protein
MVLLKRLGLLVDRQNLYFRSSPSGTISGEIPLKCYPVGINTAPQSQMDLMGNPAWF